LLLKPIKVEAALSFVKALQKENGVIETSPNVQLQHICRESGKLIGRF
jgi:hypothetical protein